MPPFVMTSASQFRAPPDYAVTDPQYTADFNEAKAFGTAGTSSRTADQSQIAKFWLENTTQSWPIIAAQVAKANGLNGWDQARIFAVLEVGQADAAVGVMESKYHYQFWRPITGIRAGGDKHGLAPLPAGGSIEVVARREGTSLVVSVTDTGVGFSGPAGSVPQDRASASPTFVRGCGRSTGRQAH